jgi:hypothetical protein
MQEATAFVVALAGLFVAMSGLVVSIKALFAIGKVHDQLNSRMTDFIARYDRKVAELDAKKVELVDVKQALKEEKAK